MSALTLTEVTVTQEHITKGERESCSDCPVALAIGDAFPEATYIWVGGVTAVIEAGGRDFEFDLPGEVESFICNFDDDGYGEPFSFTVDVPAEVPS